MSTEHITIGEVVRRLRENYPDVVFEGGELSEGFWITVAQADGNWSWERWRMVSPLSVLASAKMIVEGFKGLAHGG